MKIELKPFPEQAWLFAKISEYAYLDEQAGRKAYAELGFKATFIDVDGSQAFWLVNDDDLIIACRGTEPTEFKDIAADLKAAPVLSSQGIRYVHSGFKESANDIWPTLYELSKKYGKKRGVWCTGHSLGAAMATLIAFKLQRTAETPNPKALFTYGSPKVGTKNYVKAMEDSGLLHWRFVNNADIVTRVPPWPYQHFGAMFYMNHYGHLRAMTNWQVFKDRLRGFWVGLKKGEINYFVNHSITKYAANLERWKNGDNG